MDDDYNVLSGNARLTQETPLDPAHPITLANRRIVIPNLLPKLKKLEAKLDVKEEDLNPSDDELAREVKPESQSPRKGSLRSHGSSSQVAVVVKDSFTPAGPDIIKLIRLLPPPKHPNPGAAINIQREMKAMLATQKAEGSTACGYYYDPVSPSLPSFIDLNPDSVARVSRNVARTTCSRGSSSCVDSTPTCPSPSSSPLSFRSLSRPDRHHCRDLESKDLKSLVCEIRFPESYPMSPPFIRIVYPRFLPFIHGESNLYLSAAVELMRCVGGGGHITGGGSICHELLTSTGWSPAYAMGSILLQIRMAISNLEPRPARLDPHSWHVPYTMSEAVEGFRRAANTHGWAVDPGASALISPSLQ